MTVRAASPLPWIIAFLEGFSTLAVAVEEEKAAVGDAEVAEE